MVIVFFENIVIHIFKRETLILTFSLYLFYRYNHYNHITTFIDIEPVTVSLIVMVIAWL